MPGDERRTCKILARNNNLLFPMTVVSNRHFECYGTCVWCTDGTWPSARACNGKVQLLGG